MNPQVRVALTADYPAVSRIQAASPEAAQWPVGDYSNYKVLLAFCDGMAAGFCAWRQTAPDEAELLNLAVAPDFRRRGVAEALLTALIRTAKGDIFLEVAQPNTPAIELYRKLGWQGLGVRPGYYGQGRIDAVVMKRSSC